VKASEIPAVEAVRRNAGLRDGVAVLVLFMATWHLVARNGGRDPGDMLWVLGVAAVGVVVLVGTLRRTTRGFLWLFAAWSFAPVITLVDAEIRAGAVRPLTALALAPAVALATIHLWRRPWGPAALGVIVALAAMRSWYLTFFAWWGGAMGRPTWLALSWHNQSGTLMGGLGVAATAAAAVLWSRTPGKGARPVRGAVLVAGVVAGTALAGAWLSGSRGAVIAAGIGLAAVVLGLARGGSLRRAAPALAGVLLAAAVVVIGLESMVQSDAGQPLATRDQSAAGNLSERFGYWEAAAGMAKSRPLTGWGPGSYRWASVPHYPDHTGLSSSAHNEYLEVLGESGLVGAGPVWLALIALALLTGAAILRPSYHDQADSRHAGALAAAGAVVVLGVHAGLDFDWDYPLLLGLLVMGGAVLWAGRSGPTPDGAPALSSAARPGLTAAAAGGALLLCGVAIAGAVGTAHGDPAWELNRRLAGSMAAARAGDLPAARAHIVAARRWNPGAPSLPVFAAIVEHHAGTITDSTLAATVDRKGLHAADHLLVAMRLYISGNPSAARAILDSLVPMLEARRRWGGSDLVVQVADLQLRAEAALSGCDAAAAMVGPIGGWVESFDVPADAIDHLLVSVRNGTGCDVRQPTGD
jgi:O-antigen ligase